MMGFNSFGGAAAGAGLVGGWLGMFLVPVLVWSLAWKGWALWKAAREDSKVWFIVLLLINTVGILDILYIFMFSAKPETTVKLSGKKTTKKK